MSAISGSSHSDGSARSTPLMGGVRRDDARFEMRRGKPRHHRVHVGGRRASRTVPTPFCAQTTAISGPAAASASSARVLRLHAEDHDIVGTNLGRCPTAAIFSSTEASGVSGEAALNGRDEARGRE
jgi:hypothetical protein